MCITENTAVILKIQQTPTRFNIVTTIFDVKVLPLLCQ